MILITLQTPHSVATKNGKNPDSTTTQAFARNSPFNKAVASHTGIKIRLPHTNPRPNDRESNRLELNLAHHKKISSPIHKKAITSDIHKPTGQTADHGHASRRASAATSTKPRV